MDERAKKTALRMITYGVYVLGVEHRGVMDAATITWVSQASFKPPLVVFCVKKDSLRFQLLMESRRFALSFLGKDQHDLANAFIRPVAVEGDRIGGHAYVTAETGAPILRGAPAWVEGVVLGADRTGDHAVLIGHVTNAGINREAAPLTLEELGAKYGG